MIDPIVRFFEVQDGEVTLCCGRREEGLDGRDIIIDLASWNETHLSGMDDGGQRFGEASVEGLCDDLPVCVDQGQRPSICQKCFVAILVEKIDIGAPLGWSERTQIESR